MKRFVCFGLYVLLFSCFATHGWSETMYIRTIVKITLRTGPGLDHKIITLIKSGQEVEVLDTGKEWSRIQVPQGQTGWVMTNLLSSEKPQQCVGDPESSGEITGRQQIDLADKVKTLVSQNQRLTAELSESQSALKTSRASFASYKEAAGDYESLKSRYATASTLLTEQTKKATHLEGLVADLRFRQSIRWFLTGAGVLIVGFIIGLSIKRQRRRTMLR
jgi:SH3 domain protein